MMRTLKVGIGAPLELVGQISVRLDGKLCRTSAGFLREIGETLRFPSYYGSNWDAFEECVHDLEWLPDTQINLIVDNSDQMLAREPDRQLALFVDILREDAQWGRALTIWLDGASDSRISRACRPLVKDWVKGDPPQGWLRSAARTIAYRKPEKKPPADAGGFFSF